MKVVFCLFALVVVSVCLAVPTSEVTQAAATVFAKAHNNNNNNHKANLKSHVTLANIQSSQSSNSSRVSRNATNNGRLEPSAPQQQQQPSGNSDSNNNNNQQQQQRLKAGNPVPVDITYEGAPLVVRGRCVESCRPSHAQQIDQFEWSTSRPTNIGYNLNVKVPNALVVSSVGFVSANDEGKDVATGFIPSEKKSHNTTDLSGTFGSIVMKPVCLSRGVSNIQVVISSPGFDNVHLFFSYSCSVPVSSLCDNVDCGVPGRGICQNGTCLCAEGFSGGNCETSVFDSCPDNCHGNANDCVHDSNSGSFVCVCKPGFSGQACDTYTGCVNDTLDGCSGHGKCIDDEVCACDYGWSGRTCNVEKGGDSYCSELSYCHGRGSCVRQGNSHVCNCDDGFQGSDCSVAVVGSCPSQCSGHGVCVEGVCQCNFGYSGLDCSEAFSPCGGCNGGTCTESVDTSTPTCQCPPAYTGRHCQNYDMSRDLCKNSSFCSGHGKCLAGQGHCQCDSGYGGRTCNQIVPEGCASNCNGHGACGADDTCECEDNWSGDSCSFPRCPTMNGTMCSGHGACTDQGTAKVCQCGEGFFGVSCSNAVCKSNVTCGTHGKCKKSSGQWDRLCACDAGYTGPRCRQVASTPISLSSTMTTSNSALVPNNNNGFVQDEDDLDDFLDVVPNSNTI